MSYVTENMQATGPKGARNGQTLVPFSFTHDGSGIIDEARFEYAFTKVSQPNPFLLEIEFDWELPNDLCVLVRPTSSVLSPETVIAGNLLSIDFQQASTDDSLDFTLGFSRDGKTYIGKDLATGNAKYEDFVSDCFGATGEERSLGSIVGDFSLQAGNLVEFGYSRGFKVTDLGGGSYRVEVGRFDDKKCNCIVSTTFGEPEVIYDGDGGFFDINLGGSTAEASISFLFCTVL